jgi:hypothetical protein
MPINCPNKEKPRYRFTKEGRRLAFCGDKVIENIKFKKNKKGVLKKMAHGKALGKE